MESGKYPADYCVSGQCSGFEAVPDHNVSSCFERSYVNIEQTLPARPHGRLGARAPRSSALGGTTGSLLSEMVIADIFCLTVMVSAADERCLRGRALLRDGRSVEEGLPISGGIFSCFTWLAGLSEIKSKRPSE